MGQYRLASPLSHLDGRSSDFQLITGENDDPSTSYELNSVLS